MAVIAIFVEPHRVTRILFDCRDADPDSADQWHIEQAIEQSMRSARADKDASEMPTLWRHRHYAARRQGNGAETH